MGMTVTRLAMTEMIGVALEMASRTEITRGKIRGTRAWIDTICAKVAVTRNSIGNSKGENHSAPAYLGRIGAGGWDRLGRSCSQEGIIRLSMKSFAKRGYAILGRRTACVRPTHQPESVDPGSNGRPAVLSAAEFTQSNPTFWSSVPMLLASLISSPH